MFRLIAAVAIPTFALIASGCGKSNPVSVRGKVMLDGKPLPYATVIFIAQDEGGRDATASADANGVFQLTTFKPGDGALPGKYKVVVQPVATVTGGPVAATPEEAQQGGGKGAVATTPKIAPRFTQPDQTVLEQVIPANGEIVLDVKSE